MLRCSLGLANKNTNFWLKNTFFFFFPFVFSAHATVSARDSPLNSLTVGLFRFPDLVETSIHFAQNQATMKTVVSLLRLRICFLAMEQCKRALLEPILDEARMGDCDDCENVAKEKNVLLSSCVSESHVAQKGAPRPNGSYEPSSEGSNLFFWKGEKQEEGRFESLDVSPFVKLYVHVRLIDVHLCCGEEVIFYPSDGAELTKGLFLAAGHLKSQRSVLLLHVGSELMFVPHQCVSGRTGDNCCAAQASNLLKADLASLRERQKSESPRKFCSSCVMLGRRLLEGRFCEGFAQTLRELEAQCFTRQFGW